MIGARTGKLLSYGVKSKACRICKHQKNNKLSPRSHDCGKNWVGSSKSMEPALAVDLLNKFETSGHSVSVIHMDNDATTLQRIRTKYPDIIKKSDRNHVKKSITSQLYNLSSKHKLLKNRIVMDYIVRCIVYAINQNQDAPEKLSSALATIVPHIFGSHESCGNWCGYKKNPDGFKHKSLPSGKPLSDTDNFNHIVASKAPKARYVYKNDISSKILK